MTSERGCGKRVKGAAYFETKPSKHGKQIEYFIIDPPIKITPDDFGLSSISQVLIKQGDKYHVLDWVGSSYYPNVADFIEEVKRLGVSRRITVDPTKLTPGSNIVFVHARAYFDNWDKFTPNMEYNFKQGAIPKNWESCPTGKHDQISGAGECCAGLWWHDVQFLTDTKNTPNTPLSNFTGNNNVGLVGLREMPSFDYIGCQHQTKWITSPGIFMSMPIENIAIVDDPENGIDKVYNRIKDTGLSIEIVED